MWAMLVANDQVVGVARAPDVRTTICPMSGDSTRTSGSADGLRSSVTDELQDPRQCASKDHVVAEW